MGVGRPGGALLALAIAVAACGARTELATTVPTPTLVTACAKLLSCAPPALSAFKEGYESVSDCLWVNVDAFAEWVGPFGPPGAFPSLVLTGSDAIPGAPAGTYASAACLAAASSCGGVAACVSGDVPVDCARVPTLGTCIGDRVVRCERGQPFAVDCASSPFFPGSHCMLTAGEPPVCGLGPCSGNGTSCDGGVQTDCQGGVLSRTPCVLGTQCGQVRAGYSALGCVPTVGCINPHCEGDVRVDCDGTGARVDCRNALAIPGGCSASVVGVWDSPLRDYPCVPSPQLACNPETHADRCDGTHLVYCDGQERSIDCAVIGFHACGTSRGHAACE